MASDYLTTPSRGGQSLQAARQRAICGELKLDRTGANVASGKRVTLHFSRPSIVGNKARGAGVGIGTQHK